MLEIDTSEFDELLVGPELRHFRSDKPKFERLVRKIVIDFGLQEHIKKLTIRFIDNNRAVLYREENSPWPSKNLFLNIYEDRLTDENLLRHEFGHEADRHDLKMKYNPEIEKRWKKNGIFELAANISVDSRLGNDGLGKDFRQKNFRNEFGNNYDNIFENEWKNPPKTWPEIEALTFKLLKILPDNRPG